MSAEIVCIGQAVIDCITRGKEEKPHKKNVYRAERISLNPGGDALNEATILAHLGHRMKLVCGVGDDVAALLNARLVVVLVGERPGLSSPDSLGVYMTHAPTPGLTDEARNCISNVRAAGLPVEEAVRKLCYLVENALVRRLSGVDLKDDVPPGYLPFAETRALG